MTAASHIICSLVLSTMALFCLFFVTWLTWDKAISRLSVGVFFVVNIVAIIFITQPILWCMSLLGSLSNLQAPVTLGVGGGAYGLKYDLYTYATLIYILVSIIPIIVVWVLWGNKLRATGHNNLRKNIRQFGSIIANGDIWLFLFAVIICGLMFFQIGWSRIWYSPLGRFEFEDTTGVGLFFLSVKILVVLLTFIGIIFGVLIYLSPRPWISLLGTLICALPFAVTLSRAFTLIIVTATVSVLWRMRLPQWVRFLIAILITSYALMVPLIGRGLEGTGLLVFVRSNAELSDPARLSDAWIRMTQNVSQGFPILVEAIEAENQGANIMEQTPMMYWILSISPTISLIDGYDENYLPYNPRVNVYTPYNTISILWSQSYLALTSFMVIVTLITSVLLQLLSRKGAIGIMGIVFVVAAFSLAVLRSTQYDLRTTMRYMYVSWTMGGLILIYAKLKLKRRTEKAFTFTMK